MMLMSVVMMMMLVVVVVMTMMMTRYHDDKEKMQVGAFTVLSTYLWLLSVITRDVPGDADGNQGNDDQNGFEHDYDDNNDNDNSVTTR